MSKSLALGTIVLYLVFAFLEWNWNPEVWGGVTRFFFTCFWVILLVIAGCDENHSSENKNPYSKR